MRRIIFVSLLAGILVATVTPAKACSCGGGDPRDALKHSEAAVIATYLFRKEVNPRPENGLISSARPMDYTFRVDEEIKGDFGRRITVRSSADGASCGLAVERGKQTAMFLYFQRDRWHSSLCSQVSPEVMRLAASPLPEPDGEGAAHVLAGGSLGEAGTVALDDEGSTLGYALGDRTITDVEVCPGADRFVEISHEYEEKPLLVLRDTSTLEPVRETELFFLARGWSGQQARALACRDPAGDDVVIFSANYRRHRRSNIWRVHPEAIEILDEGSAHEGRIIGDRVYMREGKRGRLLTYFDLSSNESVQVADLPQTDGLFLSPDLSQLVGIRGFDNTRMTIADLSSDPPATITRELAQGKNGELIWLDDDTFALLANGDRNSGIEIWNDRLEKVGRVPGYWYTHANAYADGVVWGLDWGGRLYRAELPGGAAEEVRTFESPVWYDIEIIETD